MSSLTDIERRYLETILEMSGGYVLDYTNATYEEFFHRHGVDIDDEKYQTYGESKAKKMRSFWIKEPDALVGKVLSEMLGSYEAERALSGEEINTPILEKCRAIVARLSGIPQEVTTAKMEEEFLHKEFTIPNIQKLPVEQTIVPIIENRLKEARNAFSVGAYLSVVILYGSILEAVLIGKAQQKPALFNSSKASPKTEKGKVKPFCEWTLAQLIDVAGDVGILKPDDKKFSHGLRDFRNYIHPHEQLMSGFTPDEHTAKLCFQVLKAALASVAGER